MSARVVAIVAVALGLAAGCPSSTTGGEGEGEGAAGEGEGAGGEGEGEGALDPGDNIVNGAGLSLESIDATGTNLAYRDANNALQEVPVAGGSSTQFGANVDKGEYHGVFLVAMSGLDSTSSVAASAQIRDGAGAVSTVTNLRVHSLKASDDGAHLYHEVDLGSDPGDTSGNPAHVESLFLDGGELFADLSVHFAAKEKIRFSPTNNVLIVAANVPRAAADSSTAKLVRAYALDGSLTFHPIIDDGASNETSVSHDGTKVVWGANENGNVVDITASSVDGTTADQILALGGDDAAFKVKLDDTEVVYLLDTVTSGRIEAVAFDGTGRRTIKDAGALNLQTITATHIVYSTRIAVDGAGNATGAEDLHIIGLDGSGDAVLGTDAVDEGSTPDGRYVIYRDNIASGVGDLHAFDTTTGTPTRLASGIAKASIANNTQVVFLDGLHALQVANLGGARDRIADGVDVFNLVPDASGLSSHVAYARADDGIWVAALQ